MKGIIIKQSYKSVNIQSTPIMNRKHLEYIATRKGAIHNYGCGFGLFGKMPGMMEMGVIKDFEKAKKIATAASHRRTIYRAIISIDDHTAKEKGLYNRANWEALCYKNIATLAKEMDISPHSMGWAASYHHARGHPHVHIMYWDNSDKIRQEIGSKEKFKIATEHVKAAFNRDIFREELQQLHKESAEEQKLIREEILALCRESNVADALNLNNASDVQLDAIGQKLYQLVLDMPTRGRLAYAYLPDDYKQQLNECITSVLQITDFKRLAQRLLKMTDDMSEYYGNTEERAAFNREQSAKSLQTDMGNQILRYIKDYSRSIAEQMPPEQDAKLEAICQSAVMLIKNNGWLQAQYAEILRGMPKHRTPRTTLMEDESRKADYKAFMENLRKDLRIRTMISAWASEQSADAQCADKTELRRLKRQAFAAANAAIDKQIYGTLYEAAGYAAQERTDMAVMAVIDLFRMASQSEHQQQNQNDFDKHRGWGERSQTARKELLKKQEHESGWSI